MSFLGELWDSVFSPASASDMHSADFGGSGMSESHSANESVTSDWTNNFGTACDFQTPAESSSAFQSDDWSTFDSGGSFNDW